MSGHVELLADIARLARYADNETIQHLRGRLRSIEHMALGSLVTSNKVVNGILADLAQEPPLVVLGQGDYARKLYGKRGER